MDIFIPVRLAGVLFASLAYMVIGYLFYSKWGAGKIWTRLKGEANKEPRPMKLNTFVGSVASSLVQAYFLGVICHLLHARILGMGVGIGFILWAGFVLPILFGGVLYGKKPFKLFCYDAAFCLASYLCMGMIMVKFYH